MVFVGEDRDSPILENVRLDFYDTFDFRKIVKSEPETKWLNFWKLELEISEVFQKKTNLAFLRKPRFLLPTPNDLDIPSQELFKQLTALCVHIIYLKLKTLWTTQYTKYFIWCSFLKLFKLSSLRILKYNHILRTFTYNYIYISTYSQHPDPDLDQQLVLLGRRRCEIRPVDLHRQRLVPHSGVSHRCLQDLPLRGSMCSIRRC